MSLTVMQGASREALKSSLNAVERRLADASADDAARLGDELLGVVSVLDEQVGLRRALSDPAIDADRKAGLVDAVLGSHVSSSGLDVVRDAVRPRWSRMRDLGDAIEQLGVLALLIGADRQGQADEVEDELFRLARIVEARADLRDALTNPGLPARNKADLVHALLDGKATATTIALAVRLVTHPRGRKPEEGLAEYGEVAARRTRRSVARVVTAAALTDAERERLRAALARLYGRAITMQIELDPGVVGGLVVEVGDEIIDGSIAGRLADARQRLGRA